MTFFDSGKILRVYTFCTFMLQFIHEISGTEFTFITEVVKEDNYTVHNNYNYK